MKAKKILIRKENSLQIGEDGLKFLFYPSRKIKVTRLDERGDDFNIYFTDLETRESFKRSGLIVDKRIIFYNLDKI